MKLFRKFSETPESAAVFSPTYAAVCLFALSLLTVAFASLSVLSVKPVAEAAPWQEQFVPFLFYVLGFPLLLGGMRLCNWKGDPGLFGAVALISGIGLVVQYRMGSFAAGIAKPAALVAFPCGLAAFAAGFLLTAKGRGAKLAFLGWPAYALAVGGLAAMLLLGRKFRGGMYLPGNMNPTEVVKPLLVWFLAFYLAKRGKAFAETQAGIPVPPWRTLASLAAFWSVPILASILLHDLGLTALLNAVLIIMLFAVTRKAGYLVLGGAAVAAAGYAVQLLSSHASARFDVWLHPFRDPTGKGWQALQALSAMFSGGLWGAGLGSGLPEAVPIVTSDFVYAAMAEELGFAGCACVLLAYLVLFSRGFKAAGALPSPFEQLLCAGLTASLAVQTLLNIAGVAKALPMTGITLPFISHGGSSLITSLFIAGLLVGFSDRS